MLVSFKVGNYLSFEEIQTLDFIAAPIKDQGLLNLHHTSFRDVRILKSLILFGPNGSGKSNIIRAMKFLVNFARNSFKESQVNEPIEVSYFKLFSETINKPSSFEIQIFVGDKLYRYGFSATRERIHSEYLYQISRTREYLLFDRQDTHQSAVNGIIVEERFKEGDSLEHYVRPNSLFLSVVAQFNGGIATSLIDSLSKFEFIYDTAGYEQDTARMMQDEVYKTEILNFLNLAGFPFKDIKAEKVEINKSILKGLPDEIYQAIFHKGERYSIKAGYDVYDINNNVISQEYLDISTEESHGTQKMFALAGPFIDAIINSKVLVIDEFTARIHPRLAAHLLRYFYVRTASMLSQAQLIVASHNTYLMDKEFFRRDQIVLTMRNKNKHYSSEIFTVLDKDLRHDTSYVKKYFENALGAMPELGEIEPGTKQLDLFKKKEDESEN